MSNEAENEFITSEVFRIREETGVAIEKRDTEGLLRYLAELERLKPKQYSALSAIYIDAGTEWKNRELILTGLKICGDAYTAENSNEQRFHLAYNAFNAAVTLHELSESQDEDILFECERWHGLTRLHLSFMPDEDKARYFSNSANYLLQRYRYSEAIHSSKLARGLDETNPVANAACTESYYLWARSYLTHIHHHKPISLDVISLLYYAADLYKSASKRTKRAAELAYPGAVEQYNKMLSHIRDVISKLGYTEEYIRTALAEFAAAHESYEPTSYERNILDKGLFLRDIPSPLKCKNRIGDTLKIDPAIFNTNLVGEKSDTILSAKSIALLNAAYEDFLIARNLFLHADEEDEEDLLSCTFICDDTLVFSERTRRLKMVIRVAVDGFDKIAGVLREYWGIKSTRRNLYFGGYLRDVGDYMSTDTNSTSFPRCSVRNIWFQALIGLAVGFAPAKEKLKEESKLSGTSEFRTRLNEYRNAITHRTLNIVREKRDNMKDDSLTIEELEGIAFETLLTYKSALQYTYLGINHDISSHWMATDI